MAKRGRAGRDADGSFRPGNNRPYYFSDDQKTLLGVSLEARTKEILRKTTEEQNPPLTRNFFAVCPGLIRG